jgi:2-hydroxychromene-2-carboxylate isomerase
LKGFQPDLRAGRRPCSLHPPQPHTLIQLERLRLGALQLALIHFTDPACPFAFSAEPVRLRLRWHYGEQLRWTTRMIVLTLEQGEAEKLAEGAPGLQRRYGMPIHPEPYSRPASSEPACRAVVAARVHAPEQHDTLLRRLRVRVMLGGLLDDPELIAAAARDAGLDPARLLEWCAREDVEAALQADIAAARNPLPAARALDHKLGGPRGARRYTAPSYEIATEDGGAVTAVPGFNPVEVYETAIANLAPELERRPRPASVEELLAWADEPLATAEVSLVAQLGMVATRVALSRVARAQPAGADLYWTLR